MYRTLIPNMLTSSNLVFGMCSILSTLEGNFLYGSIFIVIAMIADGLDGRALTTERPGAIHQIGVELAMVLDSLDRFSVRTLRACQFLSNLFGVSAIGVVQHNGFHGLPLPAISSLTSQICH